MQNRCRSSALLNAALAGAYFSIENAQTQGASCVVMTTNGGISGRRYGLIVCVSRRAVRSTSTRHLALEAAPAGSTVGAGHPECERDEPLCRNGQSKR